MAVAVKCHKVKYTPLKGGIPNFGTSRYLFKKIEKHTFIQICLDQRAFQTGTF